MQCSPKPYALCSDGDRSRGSEIESQGPSVTESDARINADFRLPARLDLETNRAAGGRVQGNRVRIGSTTLGDSRPAARLRNDDSGKSDRAEVGLAKVV